MEDFTEEELKILHYGGKRTNEIKRKIRERVKMSEERVMKMARADEFRNKNYPNNNVENENFFLLPNETQRRLYQLISLELYGGVNYISKENNKIDEELEFERISNILETLFNTYRVVYYYLMVLNIKKDITKAIKLKFNNKSSKSFIVDLERILNNFKEDNLEDEIKRLESLLDFFPMIDSEIRGK